MSNKIERPKKFSLMRNTPQKIISLLVAIVLWLIIMDYENPEMTKTFRAVPISYTSVEQLAADKLYAESELNEVIDITVQGRRNDVLALQTSDFTAQVDMANLKSGSVELPILISCKSERITILNSNKTLIRVVLDDIVEVHKAVQHFVEGELADDLIVLNKKITPSIVCISGPKKLLDTIDNVLIPYSLDGVTASFSLSDALLIVDDAGNIVKGLDLSDERVKVDVTIGKVVELPISYNYKPLETEYLEVVSKQETAQSVTVRGSIEDLKRLETINSAEIVLPEEAGQYTLPVKLELPENVGQVKPLVIETTVATDFVERRSFTITADAVKPFNLAATLDYKIADDFQHTITLTGYRQVFESETFLAPFIEIDLADLAAGAHQVPFSVGVDDQLTVENAAELRGEMTVLLTAKE